MEAGEHTQRTVAQLSQQLRHFLDDKAWLENRRIMEVFRSIESKVFELSEDTIREDVMNINEAKIELALPMERPLYAPVEKIQLENTILELGAENLADAQALFQQSRVDKTLLIQHIRQSLRIESQISLQKIIENRPLEQGLAELVSYLQLDQQPYFKLVIDEEHQEKISWQSGDKIRNAVLPKIIFTK